MKQMKIYTITAAILVFTAGPGCKQTGAGEQPRGGEPAGAVAELRDADGDTIGIATFEAIEGGVQLRFEGAGLSPGLHGFHVHEVGLCEPPDFESAGGHFNPTGAEHALRNPRGPHLGDLPNLEVGPDGRVVTRMTLDGVNLDPSGARSLLAGDGTSLIIHADPDDQMTDPAGNAGPRIACGVLRPS